MAQYLLDTNIVSFFLKKLSPALNRRMGLAVADHLYLSAITAAELLYGVAKLPHEAKLRTLVTASIEDFQIAPWDSPCARQYARLAATQERAGATLSLLDTMIAAHALAHNLTLVTHDAAFARIPGLHVEDWTEDLA